MPSTPRIFRAYCYTSYITIGSRCQKFLRDCGVGSLSFSLDCRGANLHQTIHESVGVVLVILPRRDTCFRILQRGHHVAALFFREKKCLFHRHSRIYNFFHGNSLSSPVLPTTAAFSREWTRTATNVRTIVLQHYSATVLSHCSVIMLPSFSQRPWRRLRKNSAWG